MGYLHIGALGVRNRLRGYISVHIFKSVALIIKEFAVKIQPRFKRCYINYCFLKRKCDRNILARLYCGFVCGWNKTLCKSRYHCAKCKDNRKNK